MPYTNPESVHYKPEGAPISEHVTAMLGYWDAGLVCRFANAAYLDWFGKTREELVDKLTLKDLLGPVFELNLPYITGVLSGISQNFERVLNLPDGSTRISSVNYTPDVSSGTVKGFFAHVTDVTRQKAIEQELKRSNEQNKIFIQQAPHAIAMFDTEMRYLAASEKWYTDYKLSGTAIIGRSHYDIFPEIGADWKQIHRECLAGAIRTCDEELFVRADGTEQWITWDVRPWYRSDDEVGGILLYTADITRQKADVTERKRIEEILDKTNEIARIGTWDVDLVANTVTWSRITREIHEVEPWFVPDLQSGINFYKPGYSRNLINKVVTEAIANGTPFDVELELVTAKNNSVWVRSIGQAEYKYGKCTRVFGVFQDVTETRKAREELNRANKELRAVLNSGYVSIIGTDTEGVITHFSKGAEHLLQYTAEEMIGLKTPALIHLEAEVVKRGQELSAFYGKEISGFNTFVEPARHGEFDSREWTYIRKDGSTFPVQLVVTAINNAHGEITGFLGVATDISELKKAEQEMKSLLQITTDQNERLKNFAHIVSHNLRSHTGNIEMVLEIYLEENPGISDNEYLGLLKTALGNLKETISNLNEVVLMNTSFAEKLVPVNLYQALETARGTVSQLAKEADVQIVNQIGPQVTVLGFPAYLDSVLLNFVTNGIKYRSPLRGGLVTFSAAETEKYVTLQISDNGLGIDLKKNGSKLFGMYKTFHGNKDARGIGLFITKNQIEAMGGRIEVKSELNVGTVFTVSFKKAPAQNPE